MTERERVRERQTDRQKETERGRESDRERERDWSLTGGFKGCIIIYIYISVGSGGDICEHFPWAHGAVYT